MTNEEWEQALAWAEYRAQRQRRLWHVALREEVWDTVCALAAAAWVYLWLLAVFGAIALLGAIVGPHLPHADPPPGGWAPYEHDGGACNRMDDTGCD